VIIWNVKVIQKPGYLNANSPWVKSVSDSSERIFQPFMLDLSQPDDSLKKLDQKSVRWAVGKAEEMA
jgi:hypothetical protein